MVIRLPTSDNRKENAMRRVSLAFVAIWFELLTFSHLAHAQDVPPPPPPPSGPPVDVMRLFHQLDTNHDGLVSEAEWRVLDLPMMAFKTLDLNKDGYLTPAEMASKAPPPGVDTDGDGYLSADELRAFAEKMKTAPPPAAK